MSEVKLVGLNIYGYGQLEDVQINNLQDFQVFFGENEAGKSTVMAFIHGILFGFPTKQQSTELRYEPKNGSKYGGKISVNHEKYGLCVIERVKGKAAGEVKVALENGTVGGEELLQEILANFDKSLFQAIFSFNLHGLQNIHQMNREDIGKFLFSAGTLGTERLVQTEMALQKELELRFKPGGRKPLLNEKLHELQELSGELKKASAKIQQFEDLVEKKEALQKELTRTNRLLQELQEKAEKLNEWKKIETLVKEKKWLKKEGSQLGEIHFPARGIERLEKLNQLLHPISAQVSSFSDRMESLKRELASLSPNLIFLENESVILTAVDQLPLYDQLKLEAQQCETRLKELEEKLAVTKEKLHLTLRDDEYQSINTNISMKNLVEKASRTSQRLFEKKQELEEQFQDEKNSLEDLEKDLHYAESLVLSNHEREELESKVILGNDKKSIEMELTAIRDKIDFYQLANEQEEKQQKEKKFQLFTIELILIGLIIYGLLSREWILLFIGVISAIIMAILINKGMKPKGKETGLNLEHLREKERQLIQSLQSADTRNLIVLEEQLKLDNLHRENLQSLKMKLQQQQGQYEKVILKFEEWESESLNHHKQLSEIARELRIPFDMANTYLQEAFQLIEQLKLLGRDKSRLNERLEQINRRQEQIAEGLTLFASRFLPEAGIDLNQTAYLLRRALKDEHEKRIKSSEKQMKLADLETELAQKQQEQKHLQMEIQKLLLDADTENEKQYYELGEKAEKQKKYLERLSDIQKQLQYSLLTESDQESYLQIHDLDEVMNKCSDEARSLQNNLKKLQEELASVKYEIQVLEEGGMYSDLLHQYKQKKFELQEAANDWAGYSLAQDILQKTIEKYKNVHLPRMLSRAEEYLSFLTDGSYHKIHLQKSGTGFLIERNDHVLFEANELSQATTEQVYVSIRFALATTLYEKYHFPILIDDSFVNFDEKRTQKVIELLKGLKTNQILFFTCHTHLLKFFQKENILCLEKGALQILS